MSLKQVNFVTTNRHKFKEVAELLKDVAVLSQYAIDIDEIQTSDPDEVILCKVLEAKKSASVDNFIVEDTSLSIEALNGFPGPFIKFMEKSMGVDGIYKAVKAQGDSMAATATTIVAYHRNGHTELFHGSVTGTIVPKDGPDNFGFDCIFVPNGSDKTYANMSLSEKNKVSHRGKALSKFCDYLMLSEAEVALREDQL